MQPVVDDFVADFAAIDWQRPWLAEFTETGKRAAALVLDGASVAEALNAASATDAAPAVRFVGQQALPPGMAYEQFIFATRQVPTRDNLHDFFNGLIWLHFPVTKRLFNQWQTEAIRRDGVGSQRGALRDAITVFDENGALLMAPAELCEALAARQWQRLCVDLRPLWTQVRLVPFGHALLEKLVVPRKPITAHVLMVDSLDVSVCADGALHASLCAERFAAKPFNPLPVLGVPGWWPENENFCFYDDSIVFRSARRKISQQLR